MGRPPMTLTTSTPPSGLAVTAMPMYGLVQTLLVVWSASRSPTVTDTSLLWPSRVTVRVTVSADSGLGDGDDEVLGVVDGLGIDCGDNVARLQHTVRRAVLYDLHNFDAVTSRRNVDANVRLGGDFVSILDLALADRYR